MPLYSGPLPQATAVLPMGQFHLYAKITESAGAYATYDINLRFPTVMPSEREYYEYREGDRILYRKRKCYMSNRSLQSGAAGYEKDFVKCCSRVPQAGELYCSCCVA